MHTEDIDASLSGDIDNDGDIDLILMETEPVNIGFTRATLKYYKNDGSGVFSFIDEATGDANRIPMLMNINQDEFLDLVSGRNNNYINDNGDIFANEILSSDLLYFIGAVGDLDGDGDSELVLDRMVLE